MCALTAQAEGKERHVVTQNQNEESIKTVPAGRREFLRNALRMGGAAALMLTAASRRTLADGLALREEDLGAARRAQQVRGSGFGAPAQAPDSENAYGGCSCESCTGTCSGGCTSCQGCQGTCSNTSK